MPMSEQIPEYVGHAIQEEHHCSVDESHRGGIRILRVHEPGEWEDAWIYVAAVFASQQDIAEGEAAELGELLSAHECHIKFCPFCGIFLKLPLARS